MTTDREFVDYVEDGKVKLAVRENEAVEIREFDDLASIEAYLKENLDVPDDIRQSMIEERAELDREISVQTVSAAPMTIGGHETKYLIAARHAELENNLLAGVKPPASFYADLARKDVEDFAKLDGRGRDAVRPDFEKAASLSKEYAEIIKQVDLAEPVRATEQSAEELEELRKKLAANHAEPLSKNGNALEVERSGAELGRGAFVKPVVIARDYEEKGLEFHLKKKNLYFRVSENGSSLHTNTPDKKIVEDMVALARAKQWRNLKLNGSKEFRREAWLQAESLGMKTTGYTPSKEDRVQLESLRGQRQENAIVRLGREEKIAPRSDSKVSESMLQTVSALNRQENLAVLMAQDLYKYRSQDELNKLADLRSMLREDMKQDGVIAAKQAETLARFDKHFAEPRNLEAIQKESNKLHELRLPERKTQEQEQGL